MTSLGSRQHHDGTTTVSAQANCAHPRAHTRAHVRLLCQSPRHDCLEWLCVVPCSICEFVLPASEFEALPATPTTYATTTLRVHHAHGSLPLPSSLSNSEYTRHCYIPPIFPLVRACRPAPPLLLPQSTRAGRPPCRGLNCFAGPTSKHTVGPARAKQPALQF